MLFDSTFLCNLSDGSIFLKPGYFGSHIFSCLITSVPCLVKPAPLVFLLRCGRAFYSFEFECSKQNSNLESTRYYSLMVLFFKNLLENVVKCDCLGLMRMNLYLRGLKLSWICCPVYLNFSELIVYPCEVKDYFCFNNITNFYPLTNIISGSF